MTIDVRRALPLLVVAVALGAALAGCGGGARSDAAQPAADPPPAANAAVALEHRFVHVIETVAPSVVQIETGEGLGSGVVFDRDGDIVTNAHVVGTSRNFVVTLSGGKRYSAVLVGTFVAGDLAVIHLQGATPRPARLANSSAIHVGDFVLAIGNPLGLRSSVTEGIVSSLGRTVSEGNAISLPSAIQTSAAVNPGNSGGALVDLSGEVVGIPTLAALDPELGGSQAPGIGFAIPSNTVRRIATQLVANGRVVASGRAFLGIEAATMAGGVLVARVPAGGPAAKAGIRRGDIIVAVNGHATPTTDVLSSVLADLKPDRQVAVTVLRSGGRVTVQVTLGELQS